MCFLFMKLVLKAVPAPSETVKKVGKMKERHTWSVLIMNNLLENASMYQFLQDKERKKDDIDQPATAILIAAKNGITEMVEKILERYPIAMYDVDRDRKNIVLLTVKHKQPRLYELLLSLQKKNTLKDSIFSKVDCDGNSALHLAAEVDFNWPVPGAASQMQWEIKWYEYIKNSKQRSSGLPLLNKNGQTPEEVFTEKHKDLVKMGGKWLTSTCNACSVVAGLFVTITFTASTTVPDAVKEVNKNNKASKVLAVSSFVSFCTSLIAVVMFLSILTSGYREKDFHHNLLLKLLVGLTAFYVSIVTTLISFSSGHFFIFSDQQNNAVSLYMVTCLLLITIFVITQFPLYLHLLWANFKKVPQRRYWLHLED
ncbi:hypothetical protein RGQ29_009087 [Quercus rubra]|uniref:PGG domain-containing protein n=1 Tax=Quercus rubra TaxID=3512 RepID=A0AAN7E286_QUERU|nr:hypothetical protein RGQ29_009087 [Quercus rubra]